VVTSDGVSGRVQHKNSALCWAARLMTMVPALVLAVWSVGAYATADSHHIEPSLYLFDAVLFTIGLLAGVIAFWQHRIGGWCVLLVALVYVMHGLFWQQDVGDTPLWVRLLFYLPFVIALLAGGILHLLAGRREERLSANPAAGTSRGRN
jgi:hypothetical protein